MLKKFNAIILGCIFLFVTPFKVSVADSAQSEQLNSLQAARIIVPRAIVYSDESLNSPIGYISNDKLITVGNPRKNNPDLVPTIVYGRLAYIETKNIHFENEKIEQLNAKRGAPREHNIDLLLTSPEEKLSENNSAYFSIHQFSSGNETSNIVNLLDDSTKNTFTSFGASLIHRQTKKPYFAGLGYEYHTLSTPNFNCTLFMLNPIFGYTPIRNSVFNLDLIFSLDFTMSAQLKIQNDSANRPSAFIWGPQFSSRMSLFPNQPYHPFGSLGFRNYNVLRLNDIKNSDGENLGAITKMSGIDLSIGLAFEI